MSTVVASNLPIFSDATGHGCQSHLVFASNQNRWWLFAFATKTATVVKSYVSSSNDLTTATWSASTDSPAFPSSRAISANDQRNLGVKGFANGSTDVVHLDVGIHAASANGFVEHIRATLTGASSITWESWSEYTTAGTVSAPGAIKGNTVGISSTGKIHTVSEVGSGSTTSLGVSGDPDARLSTNADTTSTWTSGYGSYTSVDDGMAFQCNSFALAQLASDAMLVVYETASGSDVNSGGLKSNKYTSGTTWPNNTGSADVGIGTSTEDENDWCLCTVDATHIYAFRRSGSAGAINWRKHDGNTTWSTPANGVPTRAHKAGSGFFAATDGTDLYLFVLDTTGNQALYYCKATGANGTTPTWGAWTQLEAAGSTARNYISGYPVVANNQIGVIFTDTNGSNNNINVTALSLASADVLMPQCWC